MKRDSVSIVIPAYNEEHYIVSAVKRVYAFLSENFSAFEIILVDDGSRDGTCGVLSRLSENRRNVKILKNAGNRGKGCAVKKGVLRATSEYIAFSDADLSTPIGELDKFISALEEGNDIAIGSRALRASNVIKRQHPLREGMGKVFNFFVQAFLFKGIKDTQCGFKCFKRDAARKLFSLQRLRGFAFDAEILFIARKLGFKIKEIPVSWSNREDSRVLLLRSPFRMFLDIFRIRRNYKKGYYESEAEIASSALRASSQ